jgi:hypothetical protein
MPALILAMARPSYRSWRLRRPGSKPNADGREEILESAGEKIISEILNSSYRGGAR